MKLYVLSLLVVGCGISTACGEQEPVPPVPDASPDAAQDADAGLEAAAFDAGPVVPNPACIETADSIATCAAIGAAGSWTAPGTCVTKDSTLGRPQRRVDGGGGVVERESSACCTFVVSERVPGGITAVCCSELSTCDGG